MKRAADALVKEDAVRRHVCVVPIVRRQPIAVPNSRTLITRRLAAISALQAISLKKDCEEGDGAAHNPRRRSCGRSSHRPAKRDPHLALGGRPAENAPRVGNVACAFRVGPWVESQAGIHRLRARDAPNASTMNTSPTGWRACSCVASRREAGVVWRSLIAEIELNVLARQCLDRRFPGKPTLVREIGASESQRNAARKPVDWRFTAASD